MNKSVKVLKTDRLLTERGIQMGDTLNVINDAPSEQRKGRHAYLVRGSIGTSIVVYDDEVLLIIGKQH